MQGIEQSAKCVFVGGGDNFLIIKRFGILLNFCFIILFWLKEGNNKIQESVTSRGKREECEEKYKGGGVKLVTEMKGEGCK